MYFKYLNQTSLSERYIYMEDKQRIQITSGIVHHPVPLTEAEFEGCFIHQLLKLWIFPGNCFRGHKKILKPENRSPPCLRSKEEGLRKI